LVQPRTLSAEQAIVSGVDRIRDVAMLAVVGAAAIVGGVLWWRWRHAQPLDVGAVSERWLADHARNREGDMP